MSAGGTDGAPHTAQCIDRAASGHPRHTFVRALYASWFVVTVFGFAAVVLWSLPVGVLKAGADATSWLGIFLVAPIYVLFLVAQIVLSIIVTAATVNAVHRRLTGLANLLFYAPIAFFAPMIAIFSFATALGIRPSGGLTPMSEVCLGVAYGIISVVAFEATGQAWWQLTVGREAFFSVRAWRPPPFFVLTTFLRELGLPGYLSFTRGDLKLPLLYFGVAVMNAGIVSAVLVVGFVGTSNRDPNAIWIAAVMAALLLLQAAGVGRRLRGVADREETRNYQKVRQWDARPPIVFLRSFEQDDATIGPQTRDPFLKLMTGVSRERTIDEIILENASPYGPVIAIGDPRDPTPPLGAARVYVADQGGNWHDVVGALVNASRAVVMCPTATEGVSWELDFIERTNARTRTIFLASPKLSDADVETMFEERVLGRRTVLKPGQIPIAVFCDPARGWRVLSVRKRSVSSYTVALNMAIQAMFGLHPARPVRPPVTTTAQTPPTLVVETR